MLKITKLPSGYVHIRGRGPCNWAQVPRWPCLEEELEDGFFVEAGEPFRFEAESERNRLLKASSKIESLIWHGGSDEPRQTGAIPITPPLEVCND